MRHHLNSIMGRLIMLPALIFIRGWGEALCLYAEPG